MQRHDKLLSHILGIFLFYFINSPKRMLIVWTKGYLYYVSKISIALQYYHILILNCGGRKKVARINDNFSF